ncbi:MAG TPA: iron-containing alcohol dehydrogenase [Treponemataceae bacterium]|nr:iron-containing alcohol dehydrogenase [Treponemataceae bacterium]
MNIFWQLKKVGYRVQQTLFRILMQFLKYPEQTLFTHPGDMEKIPDILKDKGLDSVFIACSKTVLSSGALDTLLSGLKSSAINYTIFDRIQPNATTDNASEGVKAYRDNSCKAIIAIGGGSVLDCAKIIGLSVNNPSLTYEDMKRMSAIKKRMPLFIAVPTTAGTGSESSVGAVITNIHTKEKYAVISLHNMCDYVILDETLTLSLPSPITAYTGMDALTHAVEAYISKYATEYTNSEALKAIKLIFENLPAAVENGNNTDARRNMLLASNYAANAFTRAYTGYVHTISHAFGALYNSNHGKTNAAILPLMLRYYGKSIEKKLAEISVYTDLAKQGESKAYLAEKLIHHIESLNLAFGITPTIPELKQTDIPLIAKKALAEGNPAYPVPKIMNFSECCGIIEKIVS